MTGYNEYEQRGIIPRAMEQINNYKKELEAKGWIFNLEVTYFEIYNESIRDLLRNDGNDIKDHKIKKDTDNNIYISDLNRYPITDLKIDIQNILAKGNKNRAFAATNMNESSSRSHSIFSLHLSSKHLKQKIETKSVLNLVDLAGSERVSRSGVVNGTDRWKESVGINQSLSSLSDVFSAISKKQSHIPFRNSKLTFYLQQCLSGDGKTMMVNILFFYIDILFFLFCYLFFLDC